MQHAYAGQVSLLDVCLEELLTAIDALPADRKALFAITSPRAYPLGEHGQIGTARDDLYSELIQLPLIIRHPDKYAQFTRLQDVLQPADLFTTLQEAFGIADLQSFAPSRGMLSLAFGTVENQRSLAICQTASQLAVRSIAWLLKQELTAPLATLLTQRKEDQSLADPLREELFVKPDDRFEVVEIASRMAQLPPQLVQATAEFLASLQSGKLDASIPQHALLRDTWH